MSTFDFKKLHDKFLTALDLKQQHDPDLAKLRVSEFVNQLDSKTEGLIVSIIPELRFIYSKNVGNGANAVLKILNCHFDIPDMFSPTAEAAAHSAVTTLGYELRHARYWRMASIINRAIQATSVGKLSFDDITYNRLIPSLGMLEAGVWMLKVFNDWISYVPIPEIHHENGQPHCEDGPAFVLDLPQEKVREWFIQGVRVTEKIVLHPELQHIDEINAEENEERKRIRIERYGWPRYLQDVGAESLEIAFNERDQQWEQLFRLPDGQRRFCVADPSTGRKYALRVEDTINTCQEAQQWCSHGLDSLAVHRS